MFESLRLGAARKGFAPGLGPRRLRPQSAVHWPTIQGAERRGGGAPRRHPGRHVRASGPSWRKSGRQGNRSSWRHYESARAKSLTPHLLPMLLDNRQGRSSFPCPLAPDLLDTLNHASRRGVLPSLCGASSGNLTESYLTTRCFRLPISCRSTEQQQRANKITED